MPDNLRVPLFEVVATAVFDIKTIDEDDKSVVGELLPFKPLQ